MAHKKLKGFTLLELAIVLGVIGLILAAIWPAASGVWNNKKLNDTQLQMMTVVQNIRGFYAQSMRVFPSIAPYTTANVDITSTIDAAANANPKLIPTEMDVAGGGYQNAFGGIFKIILNPTTSPASTTLVGSNSSYFRVVLQGLSMAACMNLLAQQPVLQPEVGIVQIGTAGMKAAQSTTINVNSFGATNPGSPVAVPFAPTVLATWCAGAGNTNEVDIDFKL